MRNVSVCAAVACLNYPLIIATIRQHQWYCAVAINRAQKLLHTWWHFFWQFKVAFGVGKQFGCRGSAPDPAEELTALPRLQLVTRGLAALSPIILRPTGTCGSRSLALGLGLRPFGPRSSTLRAGPQSSAVWALVHSPFGTRHSLHVEICLPKFA